MRQSLFYLKYSRKLDRVEGLEGSPNGMAPLLKSGGRKPLEVRVLYPPQWIFFIGRPECFDKKYNQKQHHIRRCF